MGERAATFFFIVRAIERFTEKVARDLGEVVSDHRAITGETPIVSIFVPTNIKGAVIVEGARKFEILKMIRQVKQARGLMPGKMTFEEVCELIDLPEDLFLMGEMIEIIAGPFNGCEGRVISDNGGLVTVTILEWEASNEISLSRTQIKRRER